MYLKHNRIIIFVSILTFLFYLASQETLGGEKTFKKNAVKKPPDNAKECPRCKRNFSADFLFCPFDRTSLKIKAANITTETLRALQGIETYSNTIGMEFVYVPPGTFMMGNALDDPSRRDDETLHGVTLTKGIYIQTTEVTQGQWKAVMGNILLDNNPSHFKDCGDACPVDSISWNDAQIFIQKLNKMEGIDKYRLPTEAEWEYACRAGSVTAFANGDISEFRCNLDPNLDAMGWYCGNAKKKTHPVAQKAPNAWGLYDMHGNVLEWCQDRYKDYPDYVHDTDPPGPTSGLLRVARGGSYTNSARFCRAACRFARSPREKKSKFGFRIARDL